MSYSSITSILGYLLRLICIPAVSERIHKLEQNGIISGYEAIVDPKKVGLDVSALITLFSESSQSFEKVVDLANKKKESIEEY